MNARRLRLWVSRMAIGAAIFAGAGYASAFASVKRSEMYAAIMIARELGAKNVFVLPVNGEAFETYPGPRQSFGTRVL